MTTVVPDGGAVSREKAVRRFFAVQVAFIVYVILEVIIASLTHLHATENTSSIGMKGDTAVSAAWPFTLAWAVFVLLAYALKQPIARAVFAVLATLYAISITVGNAGTIFGTHHFTGWHWALVVVLDIIAALFTVLCVWAAIAWARAARKPRSSGEAASTSAAVGTPAPAAAE